MDGHRSRSPSVGRSDIRQSASPSPSLHTTFTSQAVALGSDPLLTDSFASQAHHTQGAFNINQSYLAHAQQQHFSNASDISSHTFLQAQSDNLANQYPPEAGSSQNLQDPASFSSFDNQYFDPNNQSHSQDLESLYIDASALDQPDLNLSTANTSNTYNMSTLQQRSPEAPHMMQQTSPYSPTPNAQTASTLQHDYNQRNSLDPNSAAEWYAYRGHRRAPSDAPSDVSSSAQVSPYLGNAEYNDALEQNSPLLNANHDPILYNESLGFGSFTINDQQIQPAHISPGHSPRLSPHVGPQQPVPQYAFGMLNSNGFSAQTEQDLFPPQFPGQEPFPSTQNYGSNDPNQADQFSPPPEINIEYAPPPRQPSFEPNKDFDNNLVPPSRRGRRSTSDPPYMNSSSSRGNSPSPVGLHPSNSLSPRSHYRSLSRPTSPSGITKSNHLRRASVGAVPRNVGGEDLLSLAGQSSQAPVQDYTTPAGSPGSNASNAGDNVGGSGASKRAKHPANFQCTRCSKRFTRAYNLRSHLRTHTDERPYSCDVCGKAFARQHDRKRHQDLHSGEKKFVCQGALAGGTGQWGCGRRFARADALGRHFKSEAGRSCIKPLLDEEAHARQIDIQNQAMQDHMNAAPQGMPPVMAPGPVDYTGVALPAALLQQYPVLADMWDTLQQGNATGGGNGADDEDYSARSSFDASSGGEGMYDDDEQFAMDDNWAAPAVGSQAGAYGH